MCVCVGGTSVLSTSFDDMHFSKSFKLQIPSNVFSWETLSHRFFESELALFFFLWSLHFSKVISVCCHSTFQKGGFIEGPSTTQPWPSPFTIIAGSLQILVAPPSRLRSTALQPEAPPSSPRPRPPSCGPALQPVTPPSSPRPRPPARGPAHQPAAPPSRRALRISGRDSRGACWVRCDCGSALGAGRAWPLWGDCLRMKRPAAWRPGPRGKR